MHAQHLHHYSTLVLAVPASSFHDRSHVLCPLPLDLSTSALCIPILIHPHLSPSMLIHPHPVLVPSSSYPHQSSSVRILFQSTLIPSSSILINPHSILIPSSSILIPLHPFSVRPHPLS